MAIINSGSVHALEFIMGNWHKGCPNWIVYLKFKKFTLLIQRSETQQKRDSTSCIKKGRFGWA